MANKNSKKIEDIARITVEKFFLQSQTVDTYLASNDKEPIWDGHFYLYNEADAKKDHFIGRIPAQIKGKVVKRFKMSNFTYPIKMTDLKGYLHEGTYYIVVQETMTGSQIFYRELTPVLVRNIIRAHKGQNSVNVVMYQFPEVINEAEINLRQFMIDCRRQTSFADAEPFTFEDLKTYGITSLSITKAITDKTIPSMIAITQKPLYIYANIGDKIHIPLGEGPMTMTFAKDTQETVSVNGTTYYTHYNSKVEKGYVSFSIGNCLTVIVKPQSDGSNLISLKFETNIKYLREAVRDADFIVNLAQYRTINIGRYQLDIPEIENHGFIDYWKDRLKNWNAFQETLDILNIKEDFDLTLLNKTDNATIDVLVNMIKDKKEVSLKLKGTSIINLKLANLYIRLMAIKLKNGKYRLFNYFDRSSGIRGSYKYPDGTFQDSIYSSIETNDIVNCCNLYYEDVIPSYEEIKAINPHVYERANQFGLYLLLASDLLTDNKWRRSDLMHCACSLFEWILDNDDKNYDLYELNIIQAHKRLNMFSEEDKANIERMLNDSNDNVIIKFGAYLLTDNIKEAKNYWEKIDKENKQAITKLPIWKYTNGKINLPENNCYNS